jgi:hypothetical protein
VQVQTPAVAAVLADDVGQVASVVTRVQG